MTNIVGGNTGNLSQPGSSQDGSSSNPLTKNAGLDFLSLISVVYDGQKNSNGEVGSLDNTGKSETITGSNISFGLPNRHSINSTFLPMAIASGMSSAIMNPTNPDELNAIYAANLLMNRDKNGSQHKELSNYFDKITEIEPVIIKLNNKEVRKFWIYYCTNYQSKK